jgi:hypothetical protein
MLCLLGCASLCRALHHGTLLITYYLQTIVFVRYSGTDFLGPPPTLQVFWDAGAAA